MQELLDLLGVFLYAVRPGAADRACGIQVARLAGLPSWVADRAEALLADATRETATERAVAEDRAKGAGTRRRSTANPGADLGGAMSQRAAGPRSRRMDGASGAAMVVGAAGRLGD
jgi:DNA mismatch repair ATPase MutS